ncbi:SRPBCC domain-containing protein [Mesorhizobium sp.]|uniref:SRPBCC family protein n=1 Tax=Mesorhizobium sp. TaxID=1871066 RepID=UPI0025BFF13A|nr:SRPBCC domain-containing protein [Mesorhizobium sp.]
MPIKKDETGKHWVEMEFITPGTPEQVWRAIATGSGNTAWFTKTTIDEHVGGRLHFDFGPNGASTGEVTIWEPPFRFGYVEREWSEGAPPVATEITVTSRSGDHCVVRMVHSLFASTDDWDDQLEGFESGWPGFFEVLRVYLSHFAGEKASSASWPTRRPASSRLGGGSPRRSVWPAQTSVRSGAARNSRRDYPAWSNACGRTTSSDLSCCA